MGVELELKFAADKETFGKIQADYPGSQTLEMETAYYDTPASDLSKRRWTLRKRLENNAPVCTVKTPLKDYGRGEWEVEESDIMKAIPRLCALGAPEDLLTLTQKGVIPICGARFIRLAVLVEKEDLSVELAMDTGILTGCGKEIPLCEVELEYKSGNADAFFAFAEEFRETYQLRAEPLSKFRRALNLYNGVI